MIKKILGYTLKGVLLSINIIVAILFIISAWSDHISPLRSVLWNYIAFGFPFLALLNVLFVFFWAVLWRPYFLISLIILLFHSSQLLTYCPINKTPADTIPSDFSIMTYNVHDFCNFKTNRPDDPNPIIKYILNSQCDIVCMQEFSFAKREGYIHEEDIIEAVRKTYPYNNIRTLANNSHAIIGVAIFSKYPIEEAMPIEINSKSNGSSLYRLKIKGKDLTIINNHLESNKISKQDKDLYELVLNDFKPTVIDKFKNTVISKVGTASKIRATQSEIISKIIAKQGDRLLVLGDFNEPPQTYTYHTMKGNLKDAYVACGTGPGVTYNANKFWFRIDHVFYGNGLTPISTLIDKKHYSDHYPVISRFAFN